MKIFFIFFIDNIVEIFVEFVLNLKIWVYMCLYIFINKVNGWKKIFEKYFIVLDYYYGRNLKCVVWLRKKNLLFYVWFSILINIKLFFWFFLYYFCICDIFIYWEREKRFIFECWLENIFLLFFLIEIWY